MDDEIKQITDDYKIDSEESESVREIADAAGIDEDDAYMLYEKGISPADL